MQAPQLASDSLPYSDRLLTALFIATLIHAFILLGVGFSAPQPTKLNKSIEITLSHAPVKKPPKQAKYLAQDNQIGAGQETSKPEPLKQALPTVGHTENQPDKPKPEAVAEAKKPAAQKLITQKQAPVKIETPVEQSTQQVEEVVEESRPKLTAEALQSQIAQLGEQIRNNQQSAQDTKIKFVNSVSTHKYLAAQYVKDWEDKVERTGNLNYPEAARSKKGAAQMLTMDVGINADGSIYSIRIARSSGNPALDEAAKRIVKLSAPFAALPTELLQELSVLVITRVWKFSDETGMTSR